MQLSKDKASSVTVAPIHRTIPAPAEPAAAAGEASQAGVTAASAQGAAAEPGAAGQAAVTAAALHELDEYARNVEEYVASSQLDTLVTRVQAELDKDDPAKRPRMRLRRD